VVEEQQQVAARVGGTTIPTRGGAARLVAQQPQREGCVLRIGGHARGGIILARVGHNQHFKCAGGDRLVGQRLQAALAPCGTLVGGSDHAENRAVAHTASLTGTDVIVASSSRAGGASGAGSCVRSGAAGSIWLRRTRRACT